MARKSKRASIKDILNHNSSCFRGHWAQLINQYIMNTELRKSPMF